MRQGTWLFGILLVLAGAEGTRAQRVPTDTVAKQTAPPSRVEGRDDAANDSITNSLGMKLVRIPAGSFMMGNVDRPKFGYDFGEYPRHKVVLGYEFYMASTEVTVAQFREFAGKTGIEPVKINGVEYLGSPQFLTSAEWDGFAGWYDSDKQDILRIVQGPVPADGVLRTGPQRMSYPFGYQKFSWRRTNFPQGDDHPVVNVTLRDAMEFCRWLSAREGRVYRLPTGAEWEYACRAGTTSERYTGDELRGSQLVRHANIFDANAREEFPGAYGVKAILGTSDGFAFTAPVGRYQPNPWGLYDMYGNVAEWCDEDAGTDRLRRDYYYCATACGSVVDPFHPSKGYDSFDRFPEYHRELMKLLGHTEEKHRGYVGQSGGTNHRYEPNRRSGELPPTLNCQAARGGSFLTPAPEIRSARREVYDVRERNPMIGFRVVVGPSLRPTRRDYDNSQIRATIDALIERVRQESMK